MTDTQAITVRPGDPVARVIDTIAELKALRTFIKQELVPDTDFGTIPGTPKPTLYQAGAQKVTMFFNARPDLLVEKAELQEGHVEFTVTCNLIHRPTGQIVAQGLGSCSTMESKYRFRSAQRVCPKCAKPTIFKSKNDGEGWYCWRKKDGCGATFQTGDPTITKQENGKVQNENIYDTRNTVLKIAKKRAQVDAAIGLGCMSEFFTQDIEDREDVIDLSNYKEVVEEPMPPTAPGPTGMGQNASQGYGVSVPENGKFVEAIKAERQRVGDENFFAVGSITGLEDAEAIYGITDRARQVELYNALRALPTQTKTQRVKERLTSLA